MSGFDPETHRVVKEQSAYCTVNRRNTGRRSITQIIDAMQAEADRCLDGDVMSNVQDLYDALSEGDQRTFLRSSLTLQINARRARAESGVDAVKVADNLLVDPAAVREEVQDIIRYNTIEQARMKTSWLKLIAMGSFIVFMVAIVVISFNPFDGGELSKENETFFELLKTMMFSS